MKRAVSLFLVLLFAALLATPALGYEWEEPVGTLSVQLNSLLRESPGCGECQLGELVALAVRQQQGADVAIVPAAVLENDLPVGTVTWGDICNAVDENEELVTVRITSSQLYELLEGGFSQLVIDYENETLLPAESEFEGFPQVDGFYLKVDGSARAGERVYALKLDDGTSLGREDHETVLMLATTKSVLEGDYGYSIAVDYRGTGETVATALAGYLRADERTAISGDRIQIIGVAGHTLVSRFSKWTLISILAVICLLLMLLKNRYWKAKREFLPIDEGETRRRY